VRQIDGNGEAHIADVKTPRGEVIEFQYSALHPDELAAREAFYGPHMAWIASGTRLKRDAEAFRRAVFSANPDFTTDLRAWWTPAAKAPAIVRRWAGSRRRVFLDFGEVDFSVLRLPVDTGLLWHVIFQPGTVSFMPVLKDGVIGHYLSEKQLLGFEGHSAENQRRLLALEAQLARRGRRRWRL
jgi:hypothetical protein